MLGHEGGHYQNNDLFKLWKLKNGQTIEGNFYFGNDKEIILEQKNGQIISLPLNHLQSNDLKIAQIKIHKYLQIHSDFPIFEQPNNSLPLNNKLFIILSFLFFLLFILFIQNYRAISFGFSYSLLGIVLVIYACKTDPGLTPSPTPISNTITPPKTSIGYLDSAFYPYKKTVTTAYDGTYYFVNSRL